MNKQLPYLLFLGIPSRGHTLPTLRLVKALIQDGYKVIYFNTKDFKDIIEPSGAKFVDYESFTLSNISIPISSMKPHEVTIELQKIFFKCALEILPKISFYHQKYNYQAVIYDQMAIWGYILSKKYRLVSFASNTMFLFNEYDILQQLPGFVSNINHDYIQELKSLNSISHDLNSYKDILDIQTSAKSDYIITYYPDNLHVPPRGFDKNKIIYLGNRFNSKFLPSTNDFTETALIYISLGTVFNEKPKLLQLFIDVFGTTKYQVIISTGYNESMYRFLKNINIYDNIKIYNSVDQTKILGKASLFITHAGFNSMYEGLYFAVPMLMIPHVPEQRFNAEKIYQLNAGYILNEDSLSKKSLISTLNETRTKWHSYKSALLNLNNSFLDSKDNLKAAQEIIRLLYG